jgi:hypothetical protein
LIYKASNISHMKQLSTFLVLLAYCFTCFSQDTQQVVRTKGHTISGYAEIPDTGNTKSNDRIDSNNSKIINTAIEMSNHPNPCSSNTTIKFNVPQDTKVTLSIYDITGKVVATLVNEQRAEGTYEESLNVSDLPEGVYYCQLQTTYRSLTKPIIVAR